MKQISYFHKGITTDLDYSKLDNDGLLLPTANIQLVNRQGQGLVVTPVRGNKKEYLLSSGFMILGACEFNGISYILSFNPATNQSEFGTYPSPKEGGGFENVYRPFMNLKESESGDPEPMRTDLFEHALEHPVGDEIFAVSDYDGSVSLIFTDDYNPLRLINSGFDQDGKRNERYYYLNTIVDSVKLIKSLPDKQSIRFLGEQPGGKLKYGNYFFFYRYVTASNDRTPFVAESQPVTVTQNSTEHPNLKMSGDDNQESNKKIILHVSNLDTSFAYIEFAFMRMSSGIGNTVTHEIILVDKFINIGPGGDAIVEITGYETFVPISIGEILKKVTNEDRCRSILNYDRRVWGANWKSKEINYKALRNYALKIKASANDSKEIQDLHQFYADPSNIKYAGYFRGEAYICKVSFVLTNGYETEAFAIRGINARNLEVSEIEGAYAIGAGVNNNGIIVMPTNQKSPAFISFPAIRRERRTFGKILALEFLMDEAYSWIQGEGEEVTWIKENVRAIKFLRGKRRENLLYQGFATSVCGSGIEAEIQNNVSIPRLGDEDIPIIVHDGEESSFFGQFNDFGFPTGLPLTENEKKLTALFSPDFIFGEKGKIQDNQSQLHYVLNYGLSYTYNAKDLQSLRPSTYRLSLPQVAGKNHSGVIRDINKVHEDNSWIEPTNTKSLSLINKADDGGLRGENTSSLMFKNLAGMSGFERLRNRNIIIAPYIGFESFDQSLYDYIKENYGIINIYRNDPASSAFKYEDLYLDALNIPYSAISKEIPVINPTLDGCPICDEPLDDDLCLTCGYEVAYTNSYVCYQGDCFVQSVDLKLRSWHPSQVKGYDWADTEGEESEVKEVGTSISALGYNNSDDPVHMSMFSLFNNGKTRYAHGIIVRVISENAVNAALRYSFPGENAFFPAYLNRTDISWVWNESWALFPYSTDVMGWMRKLGTGIESYLVNGGNSETISLRHYLAFNPNIPKGKGEYPNRIRYTGQQEPGYPILSYRIWDFMSKQDFDERYGEMHKIFLVFGRVVTAQHTSLMLHHTNIEETVPSTTGEMIIGTRAILSKYPITLARFGTQHRFAIVLGRSGTYGWDWINEVFWRIIMDDEGNLVSRSMSKEYMVENYLTELKQVPVLADRLFTVNSTDQEGLLVRYDSEIEEVIFYYAHKGHHQSMRFSEKINQFMGTYGFPLYYMFNNRRDVYATTFKDPNVYYHSKGDMAVFFNVEYNPVFTFVVNGIVGQDNLSSVDKLFKAMEIVTQWDPQPIEKVEFQTLFQKAENDPFYNIAKFWLLPEYLQSKWAFPINVTHLGNGQYEHESGITGTWMKVTVTLKKNTPAFIRNIFTIFITSNA